GQGERGETRATVDGASGRPDQPCARRVKRTDAGRKERRSGIDGVRHEVGMLNRRTAWQAQRGAINAGHNFVQCGDHNLNSPCRLTVLSVAQSMTVFPWAARQAFTCAKWQHRTMDAGVRWAD